PHARPGSGWPRALNPHPREQAQGSFHVYYRPNNLVGIIVGDFDPAEVKPVISRYFGRLSRGAVEPPPVVTLEVPQKAEMRMYAECDCQPQIEVRYHTVPFNHDDSFPLEMLAQILNGRTGRLYKSLVEGSQVAANASADAGGFGGPAKYAGAFSFYAEAKGDARPEDIEKGWYAVLEDLQNNPVSERELQKVKNRVAADSYRRLQSNFFLLVQLGLYEALGGWEYINEAPARLQAVTAEDIQRVAKQYFAPTNRAVALYNRKAGAPTEDPELAALDPQMKAMVKQALSQLSAVEDPAELEQAIAQMEGQAAQVPPQFKPAFDIILRKARERLSTLQPASN
ncbi:MAG: insulinase family protein, partial [Phycisphaerales bacterium]|nr:insulinase family protein [Phycisphaerales bacterium]